MLRDLFVRDFALVESLEIGLREGLTVITGESGAVKGALIANWIEAHQQNHPEDLLLAHHLGCSNDASAIRPLLSRLINTAKQQLPHTHATRPSCCIIGTTSA